MILIVAVRFFPDPLYKFNITGIIKFYKYKGVVNCSEVMIERMIRMEDIDGLPK